LKSKKRFVDGRTDVWTSKQTFETHFIRLTQTRRPKKGHVTLTMPIRWWTVIPRLTLDIFYLYTKSGDSRFAVPQIWLWASKLKTAHITLTTPPLAVVWHL